MMSFNMGRGALDEYLLARLSSKSVTTLEELR